MMVGDEPLTNEVQITFLVQIVGHCVPILGLAKKPQTVELPSPCLTSHTLLFEATPTYGL